MAANETSIDTRDWSLLGLHSVLWGGSLASSLRLPCGCFCYGLSALLALRLPSNAGRHDMAP